LLSELLNGKRLASNTREQFDRPNTNDQGNVTPSGLPPLHELRRKLRGDSIRY
jgi:hypothetical protein